MLAVHGVIVADLTLAAGENLQRRLSMRIGMVDETISVRCAAGGAVLPAGAAAITAFERRASTRLFPLPQAQDQPPAAALPVRVGGQIMAPRKIEDARPVCPRLLRPSASGTLVRVEATIGVDGYIHDARTLKSKPWEEPPPEFVESALDAIRRWRFTPTRLNNSAVPVLMSVKVEYRPN